MCRRLNDITKIIATENHDLSLNPTDSLCFVGWQYSLNRNSKGSRIFEREAVEFLQNHGILPTTMTCRNGHVAKLHFNKHIYWRCSKRTCQRKMRIRSGNWLEGSRIPISTILRFMRCWCEDLTSIEWCQRELKLSKDTTVDWNNRMREVCIFAVQRNKKKIGGEGLIVEIDESLFTKRKNSTSRMLSQQWIFGGICRETGDLFMEEVPDRSAKTLLTVITENVKEGTTIYSDCWRSYTTEELNETGFEDLKINQKYNFVDPKMDIWRNKKHRGTARHQLSTYLAEFLWRQRVRDQDIFLAFLREILSLEK
ncbi:unnamed protein product [Dracunculus medinensis]|uniref:ISXO2-like transposase domain-containing protein n=1 Tax=Dracunculus medinensis TaxID=318479 RepID=A0A3P7PP33_DRAME|nr:unnamed protein product [Dracunculus medinensis]